MIKQTHTRASVYIPSSLLLKVFLLTAMLLLIMITMAKAQVEKGITSLTLEGGPIATKHFQSGEENFRERHGLAIAKIHTRGYGNWALYFLGPNSVNDQSYGFGYVTNPYSIPFGETIALELSGALGLVTGYQDYPVPLIAAQARLKLFERDNWDAGISSAIMPYIAEGQDKNGRGTSDNEFGIVGTTPFLSLRYNFN